jgi:PEGA domain
MKKTSALVLLVAILLTPNCEMAFRGQKQYVPVTSCPAGAAVIVNGVERGVTPVEICLLRNKKGQVIRIEAAGYNPVEIRPKRRLSAIPILASVLAGAIGCAGYALYYWFNDDDPLGVGLPVSIGLGAAIGVGVGISGSSGYTLHPTNLEVTLTKADGQPRVDTILLDAEDFRSVKLIRVRKD